jgi:hypothetical protein
MIYHWLLDKSNLVCNPGSRHLLLIMLSLASVGCATNTKANPPNLFCKFGHDEVTLVCSGAYGATKTW